MNFYLSKDGKQLGPYSVEQLQIFLKQGLVTPADQVWAEGWPSWMAIESVPGLGTAPQRVATEEETEHLADLIQQCIGRYAVGKNPIFACFLSLMIVGTGQFYNGEWAKGCFLMATCIIAMWFSCGSLWLGWALFSAIDAYRVAAQLKRLNSWNWFS